jgi:DNA polymerase-3 subunit delta'
MPGADASIGGVLSALERHPRARAVLSPALAPGGRPSHAYLFHGPGGAGKRSVARAIAAELLAEGAPNPESARARVASGSHPDLTWVSPSGAHEILVSDIDAPVISAASKTPFEASRRVFVIECVDELGDEAANRMLKTLEEPPSFVHLILLTDRLVEVLPTIRSRCQLVRFDSPSAAEIAARLRDEGVDDSVADACALLSLGDAGRARELASDEGAAIRAGAERIARAVLAGEAGGSQPWTELLGSVRARGEVIKSELEVRAAAEVELYPRKERKRIETEWSDRAKRARRRTETAALDLGLSLVSLWFADLICLGLGAPELVRHSDRLAELEADAGRDPQRLRRAVELVEDTRQRFQLNVSEDLACEALCYRLEHAVAR